MGGLGRGGDEGLGCSIRVSRAGNRCFCGLRGDERYALCHTLGSECQSRGAVLGARC